MTRHVYSIGRDRHAMSSNHLPLYKVLRTLTAFPVTYLFVSATLHLVYPFPHPLPSGHPQFVFCVCKSDAVLLYLSMGFAGTEFSPPPFLKVHTSLIFYRTPWGNWHASTSAQARISGARARCGRQGFFLRLCNKLLQI